MADCFGKADLHVHSTVSDGLATPAQILEHVQDATDLDLIAVTDHDEIRGAHAARELAAQRNYRFDVIPGTEVTTREGHLLALFVEDRLPMFRSLEQTIELVHARGGLAIVPHPLSWLILSIGRSALLRVASRGRRDDVYFDGIELFNPSWAGRIGSRRARKLNETVLGLPELGGSDSHYLSLIGSARTLFPGRTAADFRRALVGRQTRATGYLWSARDHLREAPQQLWRSMVAHPAYKVARGLGLARTEDEGRRTN